MPSDMKIAPAVIEKPSFRDSAGSLFGLLRAGQGGARKRAEQLARTDPGKACQMLERAERLLVWGGRRTDTTEAELTAVLALHADLLRQQKRPNEAARLLVLANGYGKLSAHPKSLSFLADVLAALQDDSDAAQRVYLAYAAVMTSGKHAVSTRVHDLLRKLSIPDDPLAGPTAEQCRVIAALAKAAPSLPLARYGCALWLFSDGKFAEALPYADKASAEEPFGKEAAYLGHVCRAQLAASTRDYAAATRALEEADKCFPNRYAVLLALARTAAARAAAELARVGSLPPELQPALARGAAAAQEALSQHPSDRAAGHALGRLCLLRGDAAGAAAVLTRIGVQAGSAGGWADLATARLLLHEPEAAAQVIEEAVVKFPKQFDVHLAAGEVHSARAKWAEAVRAYEAALQLSPGHVVARVGLGRAHIMSDRPSEAIEGLRSAAGSGNRSARYWLARALLRAGSLLEAVEEFTHLGEDHPSLPELYYGASAFAQAGRYAEAQRALEAAEALDGADGSVPLLQAKVLLATGQVKEAEARLRRAEELGLPEAEAAYVRACVGYLRGDERATSVLRARAESGTATPTHLKAAAIQALRGEDHAAAAGYAQTALQRDPCDLLAGTLLALARLHEGRPAEAQAALSEMPPLRDLSGLARRGAEPAGGPSAAGDAVNAALWALGRARVELADYQGALACWQTLLARHPGDQRLALNVDRLHYLFGERRAREGDFAGALAAWLQYAENRTDDEPLQNDLGELHFRMAVSGSGLPPAEGEAGTQAVGARDAQGSQAALIEAAKLLARPAKAHLVAGLRALCDGEPALRARAPQGEEGRAAQHLAAAAECAEPRYRNTASLWLGLAYLQGGAYPRAATTLKALLDQDDCRGSVRRVAGHALAVALAKCSRWEDASALARALTAQGGEAGD